MPLGDAIRRVDAAAGAGEDMLLAGLHGLIAILVVAAVVFRYVLGDPLVWSEELILLLFGWMIFIGAANAFRHRTHIVIDFIVLIAPGRVGAILGFVATAVTLVLLCALTWFGARYAWREWPNVSAMMGVSAAWAILPLVVGCGLSILHVGRNLLDDGPRGALWFSDITARE
jgi:TRAP-type C4-dicarboxylate transport system permease small subunit